MHRQTQVAPAFAAWDTPTTVGRRIGRHALAGPRSVDDDAGELVAQDERSGQARVPDAPLFVPVQIRATQPHGGYAQQHLAGTWQGGRLSGNSDIALAVNAGHFHKRRPSGHFLACP